MAVHTKQVSEKSFVAYPEQQINKGGNRDSLAARRGRGAPEGMGNGGEGVGDYNAWVCLRPVPRGGEA